MATYSVNQNKQFYFINGSAKAATFDMSTSTTLGDFKVGNNNDSTWVTINGKGGLQRTDIMKKGTVQYIKTTLNTSLQYTPKKAEIAIDSNHNNGNPISGQDYIVSVVVNPFIGMSDLEPYYKYGAVHAYSGMTASKFYETLAKSLVRNFSREIDPMFDFYLKKSDGEEKVTLHSTHSGTYTGVVIKEKVNTKDYRRGVTSLSTVNFEVHPQKVVCEGDEVQWANGVGEGTSLAVVEDTSATKIPSGYKLADLEYFCMKERGDKYGDLGWPNSLPVEYIIDPNTEYCTLDIHYAFYDTGTNVQASEKDIIFVTPLANKAALKTLATTLATNTGATADVSAWT